MEFKQKFFDITYLIQREFDRNLSNYGDKIKCGRGCSECCSQIFNITLIDGFIIGEHVKSLPDEKQNELKQKALDYIEKKKQSIDLQSENKIHIPCPALGTEGECTIYEARPVICRRFGMPIYDYKNPGSINACHLNFKDGEEITDAELIPKQTEIGIQWDKLKEQYNKTIQSGIKKHTTIAESLLVI